MNTLVLVHRTELLKQWQERLQVFLGVGKDERLERADVLAVSAIAGLRASDTHVAMDEVVERMRAAVAVIALPKLPGYGPSGEAAVTRMLKICRERIAAFA